MHILLVEDDAVIADAICTYLDMQAMRVAHAPALSAAETFLDTSEFDLCILDLALPDGDGLTLLRSLRLKEQQLPVLILTAKDSVDDRVNGLACGADDYLIKPFDLRELVARIHSLQRRATQRPSNIISHGNVEYDPISKTAFLAGARLLLSRSEMRLLVTFLHHPHQVLTEAHLKDVLYGNTDDVASNALNVHIFNLRKKLGANYIITERGLGYRLATEGEMNL